jgi:hypothetical protein
MVSLSLQLDPDSRAVARLPEMTNGNGASTYFQVRTSTNLPAIAAAAAIAGDTRWVRPL